MIVNKTVAFIDLKENKSLLEELLTPEEGFTPIFTVSVKVPGHNQAIESLFRSLTEACNKIKDEDILEKDIYVDFNENYYDSDGDSFSTILVNGSRDATPEEIKGANKENLDKIEVEISSLYKRLAELEGKDYRVTTPKFKKGDLVTTINWIKGTIRRSYHSGGTFSYDVLPEDGTHNLRVSESSLTLHTTAKDK